MMTDVLPAADTPMRLQAMDPRVVSTPVTAPSWTAIYASYRAILNNVDAQRSSRTGITPCHSVVPRGAATPLQRRAQHRIAGIR